MILVDTNVVSEVMKVAPAATVIDWLNQQTSRVVSQICCLGFDR